MMSIVTSISGFELSAPFDVKLTMYNVYEKYTRFIKICSIIQYFAIVLVRGSRRRVVLRRGRDQ